MTARLPLDAPAGNTLLARVRLGSLPVGIDITHVRQVIAWPEAISRLPRRHDEVLGVFMHRNQVLPLVDLCHWLGEPARERAPEQALILSDQGRALALAIDALQDVQRIPQAWVERIHHDQDAEGFFHSVARLDHERTLLSLLDPQSLMQRAHTWAGELPASLDPATLMPPGSTLPAQALCAVAGLCLAIPAAEVGEVLWMPPLQALPGQDTGLLGMARWRGRDLPVLDILYLLGQHAAAGSPEPRLLVVLLRADGHALGLPVEQMLSVCNRLQTAALSVEPLDAPGEPGRIWHDSLLLGERRACLLDTPALFARFALSGMARMSPAPALPDEPQTPRSGEATTPTTTDDPARCAARPGDEAYLVFRAGNEWALPMRSIKEVCPLPSALLPAPAGSTGLSGLLEWRGRMVPVLDLRTPAAASTTAASPTAPTPESTEEQRLMVVQCGEHLAGLLFDAVTALLPTRHNTHTRGQLGGQPFHMITCGQGEQRRSYRVFELGALALLDDGAGPAAG